MFDQYKEKIINRFLAYVVIDTQSDPNSNETPSTQKQFDLAHKLKEELEHLNLKDISLDEKGYIMATLPSNSSKDFHTIGFVAHMDTSPDFKSYDIKPQQIENYNGEIIKLPAGIELNPEEFHFLKDLTGHTLITTDGSTLLGADNKAGISEIMTAVEFLVDHPEIEHGDVRIGFTVDEEIGRGADHFDVQKFNADFAYTIDGGELGELEYENFNAAGLKVKAHGKNVHPGYAKNIMINALEVLHDFHQALPQSERPEHTDKREGFYHRYQLEGNVEKAHALYIIRDHDREQFDYKKKWVEQTVNSINQLYGGQVVEIELTDQYYNMREKIEPVYHIVELAEKAFKTSGIEPNIKPIRGGTDGARLSFMGLPCPNIFTGSHNFHGPYELASVDNMLKTCEVITHIVQMARKH